MRAKVEGAESRILQAQCKNSVCDDMNIVADYAEDYSFFSYDRGLHYSTLPVLFPTDPPDSCPARLVRFCERNRTPPLISYYRQRPFHTSLMCAKQATNKA